MTVLPISPRDRHHRRRAFVGDTTISYVDVGAGDPIVFLHGNPTSSYLWRNIIPYVSGLGRCLAPDLVGMGQSGPSPRRSYRFADHAAYIDAWFDHLELTRNVILVVQDWGSAIGFHRARRFPEQIKGIVYMEAIVLPRRWDEFGEAAGMFRALRSAQGEEMVLDHNFFVERFLPQAVIRALGDDEMAVYRAPYREREARLPTLVWPREIPIDGEPRDMSDLVQDYAKFLSRSEIPKLLIVGDPGAIVRGRTLDFCRTWRNQREVTVVGRHMLQEDSPHQIGAALAQFVQSIAIEAGPMPALDREDSVVGVAGGTTASATHLPDVSRRES